MFKKSPYIFILILIWLVSCTRDENELLLQNSSGRIVRFAGSSFEDVVVNTKSTLSQAAESRVRNLFLVIFDRDGGKIYSAYYDATNVVSSVDGIVEGGVNFWTLENNATEGSIVVNASNCEDAEMWIIANINADMINVSPEKLSFVKSKSELLELTASLNQNVITRTGMFPMVGMADKLKIDGNKITSGGQEDFVVELKRIDAKVSVNLGVDTTEDTEDETDATVTKQKIVEFRPESWSVMNLPQGTFIVDRGEADYTDAGLGYFNFMEAAFETFDQDTKQHGFSFYMLENKHESKASTSGKYHLRDKRLKITSGEDVGSYQQEDGDMWEYAPAYSTYLVIKGEVVMEVDVTTNAKTQKLSGQVVYYIHLGDISKSMDDYSIVRNTHYTYNITIKGLDKIEVEVKKDAAGWNAENEVESGAMGMVYLAKEEIYTFDSHFGQRVFSFDQAFITPETVTWYVKTPFGREGTPGMLPDGTEVPYGLDYKWVHFMINKVDDETGTYNHLNQPYNPEKATDVLAFVKYIKQQKQNYDKGFPHAFLPEYDDAWRVKYNADNGTYITEEEAKANKNGIWYRYRIYVTVFVDEYYYDDHPINPIEGQKDPLLWQQFVNQPNRLMHILSDSNFSKDGASSATGSVITIRQHSIQTPFNYTDPSVTSGWGAETVDETRDYFWLYKKSEGSADPVHPSAPNQISGNNSTTNGRYNTMRMWNLYSSDTEFNPDVRWDKFLDYNRNNDHNLIFLRDEDDIATLRYACIMRNRDENGNGTIDAAEVKWYIASIGQLNELFIGEQGLGENARLYNTSVPYEDDIDVDGDGNNIAPGWHTQVISSTRHSTYGHPVVLWAHEGASTSSYKQYGWNNHKCRHSIRCVRNLGIDDPDEETARENIMKFKHEPLDLVVIEGPGFNGNEETPSNESVYTFDFSRVNPKSTRAWSTIELEPSHQFAEQAKVSTGFITGPEASETSSYTDMRKSLEGGGSPCPEGYRLPNVRELAMMSTYLPADWFDGKAYKTSSYYYLGGQNPESVLRKESGKHSWQANNGYMTLNVTTQYVRCVKDVID